MPKLPTKRKVLLLLFDIFCFVVVTALYYLLSYRASGGAPVEDTELYLFNTLVLGALIFAARFLFKVYSIFRNSLTFLMIQRMLAI